MSSLRRDRFAGPRWIEELVAKLWRSPARNPAAAATPVAEEEEEAAAPLPRSSPGISAAEIRAARAAWQDRLWGLGCCLPGGKEEILRLASIIRLNKDTTLLLLGDGAAVAGAELARAHGTFVAAHDREQERTTRAQPAMRNLKSKVTTEEWSPEAPSFRAGYHHHALLLEPSSSGCDPTTLMTAVAAGLRPAGHLLLLELTLANEADDQDPALRRWRRVDGRPSLPPRQRALEAAIHAAGFDLHVTEDCAERHCAAVLQGWSELVEELAAAESRPAPRAAAALVAEAEAWLLRLRLLRSGVLKFQRWHAAKESNLP